MDKWTIGMLAACLFIAGFLSLFASSKPDGLESAAEDGNFSDQGRHVIESPMKDYLVPGIENEAIAGSLAGMIGVLLLFAFVYGVGNMLKKK